MEEKKPFIKEQVKKKSGAGKTFRRLIRIVFAAVLFGIVAVVTAVVAKPTADKIFGKPEESTTAPMLVIPRDEIVVTESVTETPEETKPEIIIPQTEPVEEIVQNAIEKYEYTYSIDDFNNLWSRVSYVADTADKSVVTITYDSDLWDENDDKDSFTGIIVADNSVYIYILTLSEAAGPAEPEIIFRSGKTVPGRFAASDDISGLAIIKVNKEDIEESARNTITPVEFGNSYIVKRGDMMIAVGSPHSVPHSTAYTWASYVETDINIEDGGAELIYADNACDSKYGCWYLNSSGELIGWGTDKVDFNVPDEQTVVAGISDFKDVLESMLNSEEYAYLGITPANISHAMQQAGMPKGVYVKEVTAGSPAYESGIQAGDIITSLDEVQVNNVSDYKKKLEELNISDEISISVSRESVDEYKNIDFSTVVGKR